MCALSGWCILVVTAMFISVSLFPGVFWCFLVYPGIWWCILVYCYVLYVLYALVYPDICYGSSLSVIWCVLFLWVFLCKLECSVTFLFVPMCQSLCHGVVWCALVYVLVRPGVCWSVKVLPGVAWFFLAWSDFSSCLPCECLWIYICLDVSWCTLCVLNFSIIFKDILCILLRIWYVFVCRRES